MPRPLTALAAALAATLVTVSAHAEDASGPSAPSATANANKRPTVVVLVSVTSPSGTVTSFGSSGTDKVPAAVAITRALVARGFRVVSGAGQQVSRVAGSEEADAPVLADASAADFARGLGAGAAVIVGIGAQIEGAIRGTQQVGAVAGAQARLLDVGAGRVISSEDAKGAGFGASNDVAAQSAITDSLEAIVEAMTDGATKAWPAPLQTAGNRMVVRIRGARTWAPVSSIIRRLATTKGIRAVHPREVKGSAVTLAIDTDMDKSAVIRAIRGTRLLSGSLSAKASGNDVRVVVRGD